MFKTVQTFSALICWFGWKVACWNKYTICNIVRNRARSCKNFGASHLASDGHVEHEIQSLLWFELFEMFRSFSLFTSSMPKHARHPLALASISFLQPWTLRFVQVCPASRASYTNPLRQAFARRGPFDPSAPIHAIERWTVWTASNRSNCIRVQLHSGEASGQGSTDDAGQSYLPIKLKLELGQVLDSRWQKV